MKIAVVGAGGVGGYFGGRLAEHGSQVYFVARGEHLKKMRSDGLKILSPKGDAHITSINATDNVGEIGQVDVVIVAVKGWQLPEVMPHIAKLLSPDTLVLPLLNGIDAPDQLGDAVGNSHVLGGLCGIIAHLDGPGVIRHVSIDPFVTLGELDGAVSDRAVKLSGLLENAGVISTVSENIMLSMWQKFLFIAPISGVTSVARVPIDSVLGVSETKSMLEAATLEVAMVGRAAGLSITDKHVNGISKALAKTAAGGTTSMQRDFQSGRPTELETQTGTIVKLGRKYGVDVPVNEYIYAALLPQQLAATS